MLLIVSLLLVVVLLVVVFARRVEGAPVEGVSVTNVVVNVPVEDINVIDVGDVGIEDITMVVDEDVTEVAEDSLATLYQILSSPRSRSQRAGGQESKGRKHRSKPRSQGQKTYVSSCPSTVITIEEETEEELLARKFDEQLYGRRASKRKANYWDLKPEGRRPRDNKEKGDFRQDRRLKASRQKAVVESRTVLPIYVVGIRGELIP